MRCEDRGPRGCEGGGAARCENYPDCHSGWLPFWTPAERAGLKALGLHHCLNRDFGGDRDEEIIAAAIVEYVKAAREAKEVPSERKGNDADTRRQGIRRERRL